MFTISSPYQEALPGDQSGNLASRLTPGVAWSLADPTLVLKPKILAVSAAVADLLHVDVASVSRSESVEILTGNRVAPGSKPYAMAYGGHQFGGWAGQLGDGRAIVLGTHTNTSGDRFDLQLKGAGRTPYSRRADGRAVLRSSLREFVCSEAMHHLGVPTTRALSLALSGEGVVRDMFYDGHPATEPGAIVCRVSPSFVRFGHFELPRANGDVPLLRSLVDFTIREYFHEIDAKFSGEEKVAAFLNEVAERTARLMSQWMRVGFVHGVMNTDNMSVLGLTLDYGPYGFVEDFDPRFTPNTTDSEGRRYCFGAQPHVALWNVERLAVALSPLFSSEKPLADAVAAFAKRFDRETVEMLARKFGFDAIRDEADDVLVQDAFALMQRAELDFTIFFRALALLDAESPRVEVLAPAAYRDEVFAACRADLEAWLARYASRVAKNQGSALDRRRSMNATNPSVVFRNYLAQEAIDDVMGGSTTKLESLMRAFERPYDDGEEQRAIASRRPEWARVRAGCSMLSCSS